MKPPRTARVARFHHDGELQCNAELTLSKEASHHLITVLRTRQGDEVELFNGNGLNYRAIVQETGQRVPGKRAVLNVLKESPAISESPACITLVQGISRGDRMEITLRQSVELGVSSIQPVHTRHSSKTTDSKRSSKKQEHWQSILSSAAEQSGRARIPALYEAVSLAQWLRELKVNSALQAATYVLDPSAKLSLVGHLRSLKEEPLPASPALIESQTERNDTTSNTKIVLIIGPESGLDADEVQMAVDSGAQAVTIGPRILRTETAGPACIAVIQATLGDLA